MLELAEGDLLITEDQAVFEVINRDEGGYALSHLLYVSARGGSAGTLVPKEGPLAGVALSPQVVPHLIRYRPHYVERAYLVPEAAVRFLRTPEQKAKEVFFEAPDEKVLDIITRISAGGAVAPFSLGVGGDALVGLPCDFPKIYVYGLAEGRSVLEFLKESGMASADVTRKFLKRDWMREEDLSLLVSRKSDVGQLNGTSFKVVVVVPRGERVEGKLRLLRYWDGYQGEGRITSDTYGVVYPARYKLKGDVDQLVVYDDAFVGTLRDGEQVRFRGRLELVEGPSGRFKRVLIGASQDYAMPKARATRKVICNSGYAIGWATC